MAHWYSFCSKHFEVVFLWHRVIVVSLRHFKIVPLYPSDGVPDARNAHLLLSRTNADTKTPSQSLAQDTVPSHTWIKRRVEAQKRRAVVLETNIWLRLLPFCNVRPKLFAEHLLKHWSANFRCGGPNYPFSRNWRPVLFFKAQFQTYAVFSYLLRNNAMLMTLTV